MPNWCNNSLHVEGLKQEDIETIKTKYLMQNTDELCLDFEKIMPTPNILLDMKAQNRESEKTKEFLKKAYGAVDWYDWRNTNWGTKWNIDPDSANLGWTVDTLDFSFDSAWSPPIEIFLFMSTIFPEATFELEYAESGCNFSGMRKLKNGEIIEEDDDEDNKIMYALCGDPEEDEDLNN